MFPCVSVSLTFRCQFTYLYLGRRMDCLKRYNDMYKEDPYARECGEVGEKRGS